MGKTDPGVIGGAADADAAYQRDVMGGHAAQSREDGSGVAVNVWGARVVADDTENALPRNVVAA